MEKTERMGQFIGKRHAEFGKPLIDIHDCHSKMSVIRRFFFEFKGKGKLFLLQLIRIFHLFSSLLSPSQVSTAIPELQARSEPT
jgi:hypothetical protein